MNTMVVLFLLFYIIVSTIGLFVYWLSENTSCCDPDCEIAVTEIEFCTTIILAPLAIVAIAIMHSSHLKYKLKIKELKMNNPSYVRRYGTAAAIVIAVYLIIRFFKNRR